MFIFNLLKRGHFFFSHILFTLYSFILNKILERIRECSAIKKIFLAIILMRNRIN